MVYTHRNKLLMFAHADCKCIVGLASQSSGMSQWVKVPDAKPDDLSLVPEIHMVQEN